MTRPELSAVVVHHRGLEHLLEGLDALAQSERSGPAMEIVLVDNTGGAPLDVVGRRHPGVRRVAAGRNVGFAEGCRLGTEAARAPIALFVNDDAAVEAEAPRRLFEALANADADVVAVGGRLTDASGTRNDFSDGFLTFDGHAFQADVGLPLEKLAPVRPGEERLFACGGLMAVRRQEFLESGGFDPDYFAYLEDVDFGWRSWIRGRRIVAEPRAVARHRGGATGEALGVFARGFLIEKNAFATAYKNLDAENFRALMPSILAAFLARAAEMVAARNPGAAELSRDPYAEVPPRSAWRRLLGIAEPAATARVTIEDPLTVAQLRALIWIHKNRESLARKRREVQQDRRRPDSEIFAKFPLRLVPTYPGDEGFDGSYFREFLASAPPLVRASLAEIFSAA
jgi:GT2 family glycosyltransferase